MGKQTNYKLFLDDWRTPGMVFHDPDSWIHVKNYDQFVSIILQRGLPTHIAFDHDLADEHMDDWSLSYDRYTAKTGYDCAKWLVDNEYDLREVECTSHSANPPGRANILALLYGYQKALESGFVTL